MQRLWLSFVLVIASVPAFGFAKSTDYLPKGFPNDARSYLDRRLSCDHWASEGFGNYSGAELKRIKRGLAADHCEGLNRDELRLKAKYAGDSVVIRELERQN